MAKKKIIEIGPDDMFYPGDRDEILRLARVVHATQNDMAIIYKLYKKYINPKASMYQVNCNCSNSISKYYQELLDWYSKNASNFK